MTVQPGLRRIDVTLDDPDSSVGGGDHVADPLSGPLCDARPEDPGGDRLLPPPDPHPPSRPPRGGRNALAPRRQAVARRWPAPGDPPGPAAHWAEGPPCHGRRSPPGASPAAAVRPASGPPGQLPSARRARPATGPRTRARRCPDADGRHTRTRVARPAT